MARLHRPQLDRLAGIDTIDTAMLELVRQHDRGLIRYGSQVRPYQLIAQIALAWPGQRLAVVGRHLDELRTVAAQLRQVLPMRQVVYLPTGQRPAPNARDEVLVGERPWSEWARIACCTYFGLAAAGCTQREIVDQRRRQR